jgi:hypothetical protein
MLGESRKTIDMFDLEANYLELYFSARAGRDGRQSG